ncbi:MAG: Glu/Leu/Phe/Val dehydrogenase [Acidimicrobiales bacterium]|nr:Glu/Leu/Phe/Val dehydrogenase [Hyphomonadaceae bacterium]RZV38606.1 MAG: Glu/Leu/Phe/Val dehydrogenase [Acidimicrobiales bacterium]
MALFEHKDFDDHESVHAFTDPDSGLKAFIGIHSTHRGPAAGGARLWTYETSTDALTDVLRLSRGMSYKNAMAGLNLGGGKAVIMRPESDFDRAKLFTALGKAIDSLCGKYYTAEDVGVSPDDMRNVLSQTKFVAGLEEGDAASGDPSPVTADGVFRSIKVGVEKQIGSRSLKNVHVAVQGLGHVGYALCQHLHDAGAKLSVTDINEDVLIKAESAFDANIVDPDEIYAVDAEVFAPCALGAVINPDTIERLKCKVIAGAANNQLSVAEIGKDLMDRGILYCPDYVVNAGGIINIAGEIEGSYSREWVEEKLVGIEKTLADIIAQSADTGIPTNKIANKMARERIGRG